MLTITSYLSKTLKILSTFVVPSLITVVFRPRFLKILEKCYLTWQSGTHQRTNGDTTNRWKCFSKICSTNVRWEIFLPSVNWILFREKTFTPSAVYELPFKITIAVKIFWEKVIDWWNRKRSENINPNPTEVLCGYKPESNSFHTFNHYLLVARYYVYLARNKFETPELEVA